MHYKAAGICAGSEELELARKKGTCLIVELIDVMTAKGTGG
jgi:hypothetical protein